MAPGSTVIDPSSARTTSRPPDLTGTVHSSRSTQKRPWRSGTPRCTDGASAAVDAALEQHELVKVRLGTECPDDRDELATRLAPPLRAEVAQQLGRTLPLYRRHPKQPKIQLPAGA